MFTKITNHEFMMSSMGILFNFNYCLTKKYQSILKYSALYSHTGTQAHKLLTHTHTHTFICTVNRSDFGQIFTIFINIFIMMNSILGFIWGLVSTMQEHRILYTLNSSWLLYSEIFYLEPCPKSRLRGDSGHTNIWFSKVILLQGFKIILSVT